MAYKTLSVQEILNRIFNGSAIATTGGAGSSSANYSKIVSQSVTRPADTNVYASGDVIATATSGGDSTLVFSDVVRDYNTSGQQGAIITDVSIIDSANQTTKLTPELWLFSSSPGDDNDNAVFTPTDAELDNLIAIIPFSNTYVGDATSGAGGNSVYTSDTVNKIVYLTSSNSLYGVIVARNAYTPVSGEQFTVKLRVIQFYAERE